ncbi:MAG: DUF922 domain-containing protein [Pseudomonadota bacterium]
MLKIRKSGGTAAALLSTLLLLTGTAPAPAKPIVKTSFKSYSVPGTSAYALLSYMQANGPHANGSRALATTSASFRYQADTVTANGCRLKNFQVSTTFVITLPKATQKSKMSSGVRKRWRQFVKHARWHENRHKEIWIGCAKKIERSARRMGRQSSCNAAWAKAQSLVKTELARCDRLHAAFDRRETARASRLPLIAQALRAPKTPYARAGLKRALRYSHKRVNDDNR